MRAAITGTGIIAPKISNSDDFALVLKSGTVVTEPLTLFDHIEINAGIINENVSTGNKKQDKIYPRVVKLMIYAVRDALASSGLLNEIDGKKVGVIIGTSGGLISNVEEYTKVQMETGRLSPFSLGNMNNSSITASICSHFGISSQVHLTICNSCTSSSDAIALAKTLIETNQLDFCITGGVDSVFSSTVLSSFQKLRLLQTPFNNSTSNMEAGPFSDANCFSLSEGAAAIILESEESAIERGAATLAYVDQSSTNQDAISIYHSEQSGKNMLQAMLDCSNAVRPDYINSQALGLKENDQIEAFVSRQAFNNHVPITSIKGLTGHFLGATGAIQVISSLISMHNHFIPPTIGRFSEQYADLPIVKETIKKQINHIAITTHGYGGNNTCLSLSRT